MDDDFNPNELCSKCNHLIYVLHRINKYKANDEEKSDMTVFKCTFENCNCISIISM